MDSKTRICLFAAIAFLVALAAYAVVETVRDRVSESFAPPKKSVAKPAAKPPPPPPPQKKAVAPVAKPAAKPPPPPPPQKKAVAPIARPAAKSHPPPPPKKATPPVAKPIAKAVAKKAVVPAKKPTKSAMPPPPRQKKSPAAQKAIAKQAAVKKAAASKKAATRRPVVTLAPSVYEEEVDEPEPIVYADEESGVIDEPSYVTEEEPETVYEDEEPMDYGDEDVGADEGMVDEEPELGDSPDPYGEDGEVGAEGDYEAFSPGFSPFASESFVSASTREPFYQLGPMKQPAWSCKRCGNAR